ncbi:MAG: ComF family protein [Firmicutes bacterium]|nr:ComF family protein [Bacillota bacterium]HOB34245.1 double zinc ribbon domain-containing protein [Bacillota bacterium]HPZ89956.1 double zinc ribbon domain-containing protein [Bacillota bacterium]HQE01362.1 double zinc ribbon domain-containing protein [Bacillota bacterium]
MGSILDAFFPPLCLNCRNPGRVRFGLCSRCLAQVEFTGLNACIRCGRDCRGRHCAPAAHRYSRMLSLAGYRGPWRKVVQSAKFARERAVAVELARELARLAGEAGLALPRAVVPAPTASRHWRNFDIARLLAAELGRCFAVPVQPALARRPGRPPQVRLSRSQRLEGLEDYIYVKNSRGLQDAVVWLVDDVYTTGATASACAAALQAAGARAVCVLVLAA